MEEKMTAETIDQLETTLKEARDAAAVPDPTSDFPTPAKIEEWKTQYGRVYYVEVSKLPFIHRGLELPEYQRILRTAAMGQEGYDSDQATIDATILWPEEPYDLRGKAGVIPTLATQIMINSGFELNPTVQEL